MTAPASLPALIAEGRRLIAENDGKHRYCTMDPGPHAALRMLPALLAVAEAAERFRVSDERWIEMPEGKPETEKEWESMNDAREELFVLLTGAAVQGGEKTNG